jgi:DNA-binding CsgD family transcriptional regulator
MAPQAFRTRTGGTMANCDDLLAAIEQVHAAGIEPELWPQALTAVARLLGSAGATLESYDPRGRLQDLHVAGIPPAEELDYFEHYAAINPRATYCLRHRTEPLHWDYKILDESAMDRDPYYSEFLPRTDFRYFIAGQWTSAQRGMVVISAQRTRSQGHVGRSEIDAMARLVPHVRQAVDTAMRLRVANGKSNAFRDALDWLADGALLMRSDGTFVYANSAMQTIASRNDGIRLVRNRIEFSAPDARGRFEKALAALAQSGASASALLDFPVPRAAGGTPYLVSLRPLPRGRRAVGPDMAFAIVFVRDPDRQSASALRLQREIFGFTEAEAGVAQALLSGMPLGTYARERAVSLNTVYTHLRRIKEKTGCSRLPELIRKLNDVQLSLRGE